MLKTSTEALIEIWACKRLDEFPDTLKGLYKLLPKK
jgi:hypothetical protein